MVSSLHLRVVGFHISGATHGLQAAYQALAAGEV